MPSTPSRRARAASEPGGAPVGRRALLPSGAEEPIDVFINGIVQKRNVDYEVLAREIVFQEPIWKEDKLSHWRFAALMLVGRYQRNEVVDVECVIGGTTRLISDIEIQPNS